MKRFLLPVLSLLLLSITYYSEAGDVASGLAEVLSKIEFLDCHYREPGKEDNVGPCGLPDKDSKKAVYKQCYYHEGAVAECYDDAERLKLNVECLTPCDSEE